MAPGGPDLLLDEIEVIEQPFARGRDPAIRRNRGRDQIVGPQQDGLAVRQPRQEPVWPSFRIDFMPAREGPGMLLQLIDAEQLGSERRLVAIGPCDAIVAVAGSEKPGAEALAT